MASATITPTTMPAIAPPLRPPLDDVDCGDGKGVSEVVTDVVVPVGNAEEIEPESLLMQL